MIVPPHVSYHLHARLEEPHTAAHISIITSRDPLHPFRAPPITFNSLFILWRTTPSHLETIFGPQHPTGLGIEQRARRRLVQRAHPMTNPRQTPSTVLAFDFNVEPATTAASRPQSPTFHFNTDHPQPGTHHFEPLSNGPPLPSDERREQDEGIHHGQVHPQDLQAGLYSPH